MQFVNITPIISFMLMFTLARRSSGQRKCNTADWWESLETTEWSLCPRKSEYLKGFYRTLYGGRHAERVGNLQAGECCGAVELQFVGQPANCSRVDWSLTLDRFDVWALCPYGFYMSGLRLDNGRPAYLNNIAGVECCQPQHHPSGYEDCYDEDVAESFSNRGWSKCQREGYYMTGFYKSNCNKLNCIDKFKCCKMKDGSNLPQHERTVTTPQPSSKKYGSTVTTQQPKSTNYAESTETTFELCRINRIMQNQQKPQQPTSTKYKSTVITQQPISTKYESAVTPKGSTSRTAHEVPSNNRISALKLEAEAILSGNHSNNLSAFISNFVNLTKSGEQLKLNADELSYSVDVLLQIMRYNSWENNAAINTTSDQRNIVQIASNLLAEGNVETWLLLQEERQNITDILLAAMDDFGSQIMSYLENSINSTNLVILTENIAVRADRLKANLDLMIDFSHYGATLLVPGSVFSNTLETRMSTIVYRTLQNILRLPTKESSNNQRSGGRLQRSGSSIMSVTIHNHGPVGPLNKPIKLAFNHTYKRHDLIGQCVFWEIGQSQRTWLTRGCVRVDRESNSRVTTCECNHLTIFAVLMNNKPVTTRNQLHLKHISTIGCACSLFFLVLTCVIFLVCWKKVKSFRTMMLLQFFVAHAVSYVFIILADEIGKSKELCTTTAVLLHYFLLSVFFWMLCHGVILYFLVLKVERQEILASKKKWFYALGWGAPIPIVAVSLTVAGPRAYAADNCWLTTDHWLIHWAFVAPVAIIMSINSVLLILLLRQIIRVTKSKNNVTPAKQVKDWLRRFAMLLPILGVTWSFGFLTFITSTDGFHYIFAILNSIQGVFIFVSFCILDDSVKNPLISMLCKKSATLHETVNLVTDQKAGRQRSPTEIVYL